MQKDELIARLEAATGADRELDAAIESERRRQQAYACGLNDKTRAYWVPDKHGYVESQGTRYAAAQFTASIDAALTLVPEGWSWSVGDLRGYNPPLWRCHVRDHRPESLTPEGHSHIWREGNTTAGPALALCIAAMKACT